METKSLLIGIISFIAGGLLVATAATTFEKDRGDVSNTNSSMSASMETTAEALKNKKGDEFDQAFIAEMTTHHKGAIEMAKLADSNAKHQEIKQLSKDIVTAQEKEISQMKQWQMDWGYMNSEHMQDSLH